MKKLIRNEWVRPQGRPYARAQILNRDSAPEGLDVARLRFVEAGVLSLGDATAHIVSLVRGRGELTQKGSQVPLSLRAGVHLYVPPGHPCQLRAEAGSEIIEVTAPSAQAKGTKLLVRDEAFVAACA